MAYLVKCMSRVSRLTAHCYRRYSGSPPLVFSEEVIQAKFDNKPIVALESTIITHGMPYPKNLETALEVESIIRQRGAVPATIAILKGQLTIGLSNDQIQYLAQAKGVIKASRRDLAPIAAAMLDGATTVAGTIIAAELADIPIFVTGGIGGVHREGENTMDISADLNELGRSRTLVVCSGVKSILDIDKTLEYLETQGVCVCAFGESQEFPAFYTVRSGHRAPYHVTSAQHAACVLRASLSLCLDSGIVVAVPVPLEFAMDEKVINEAIRLALEEAKQKGIRGKEVTPFILSAVASATGGASLNANIALIKNNAKVGADIAVEFKKLKNVDDLESSSYIGFSKGAEKCLYNSSRHFHTSCITRARDDGRSGEKDPPLFSTDKCGAADACGDVLVIGGANVDRTYRLTEEHAQLDGSTHGCKTEQCGGGVARNMAEALWRLRGGHTRLLTAVGDDVDGRYLIDIAPGLLLDGCIVNNARTSSYAAVLDAQGECLMGLGDMELHDHVSVELVNRHMKVLEQAPLVVIDGNIPQSTIEHVLQICQRLQKPVFFEPTDRRKAIKPLYSKYTISYASPNLSELRAMAYFLNPNSHGRTSTQTEILDLCKVVLQYINYLIVTLGSDGVLIIRKFNKEVIARHYSVLAISHVKSVSGAGDCFASGFIHGMLSGFIESNSVSIGFETAKSALFCKNTVPLKFHVANAALVKAKYRTIKSI